MRLMSMAGTSAHPVLRVATDRPVTTPITNHKGIELRLAVARTKAVVVKRRNKCSENNMGSKNKVTGLSISIAAQSAVVMVDNPSRMNHNIATPTPNPRNIAFIINATC